MSKYFSTGAQLNAALNAIDPAIKGDYVAFDAAYYAATHMGSYSGTLSPIEHFVTIGAPRFYSPNADFNPAFYQKKYADLAKLSDLDAADLLFHYVNTGLNEGRAGNATLAANNWNDYLAAYPTVAAYVDANLALFNGSKTNGAIAHYVKFGAQQGFTLPNTAGQTFTLTTGVDTLTGTVGNDAFSATPATLTILDSINGGAGTDSLTITDASATAYTLPASITTITGIETFALNHTADAAAATDAVVFDVSTLADARTVVINNVGSTPDVTVTGSANVTAVTITGASGIATVADSGTNGTATVPTTDKIATITLSGVTGVGTLSSEALTTLNVTNAAGLVTNTDALATDARALTINATGTNGGVTDAGATAVTVNIAGATAALGTVTTAAATTATLNVNAALTAGTLVAAAATTVNYTANAAVTAATLTTAAATTVNVAANAAITASTLGAATVTALNLSGAAAMTITQTAAAAGVITSTGTGARTLVTAIATGQTYTGGDGADTISVGASTKAITTGAGDDVITLTSATMGTGGSINAGAGSDTLTTTAAIAATASATAALGTTFSAAVSGFEKLVVTGGGTNTVNVARLGNYSDISSAGDTALTLDGVTTGSTLRLTATGTAQTVSSTAALLTGTADSLNLVLTGTTTAADVAFSTTGLTATDVEAINITSSYTSSMTAANKTAATTGGFANGMIVLGNQVKTIVVSGEAGLNLTAASTALTSLDASANTVGSAGEFSWTSGATTGAVNVKGLASGINTIVLSAATVAGTYTGSANGDTVTIANALANVLNLGDGTNLVNGAASGNNVVTGGAGDDTFITATTGNNVVNFGNGANAFTATSGNNTYTGGTGVDTVSVGGGLNVLTLGAGADAVTITASGANGNVYTTITDIAAGDSINMAALTFVPRANGVLGAKISLADTAAFADYLAAGTAAIIADAGAATMKWFQFGGNTFIVVDNSTDGTPDVDTNAFENGIDSVVKLTGLVDLALSTTATDVLTIV